MKFTIERLVLEKVLKNMSLIIDELNFNPILANLKVEVKRTEITFFGSNTSYSAKELVTKKINVEKEGEFLIRMKFLYNIASNLESTNVEFELVEENLLKVTSGNFKGVLNLIENISFPRIDFKKGTDAKLTTNYFIFEDIVKKIVPFTPTDQNISNKTLSYVCVKTSLEKIEAFATDSWRLSYISFNQKENNEKEYLFPTHILKIIETIIKNKNHKNELTFFFSNEKSVVDISGFTLSFSLYSADYPNIHSKLFEKQNYFIVLNKKTLLKALSRGSSVVVSEKKAPVILLQKNNKLIVSFSNNEIGNTIDELDIIDSNTENFNFKFNFKFLSDILSTNSSQEIKISFNGPNEKVIFQNSSNSIEEIQLLLPMKF